MANASLNSAKYQGTSDEWFTLYEDAAEGISSLPYKALYNAEILCPCDSWQSEILRYLHDEFHDLYLRRVTATGFDTKRGFQGTRIDITREKCVGPYEWNADVFGWDMEKLMDLFDIVITNPPFTCFEEFLNLVLSLDKKFLVIGPLTQINAPWLCDRLKEGEIVCLHPVRRFRRPDGSLKGASAVWYTNMYGWQKPDLELTREFDPDRYPVYDNYDAINVNAVKDIPKDYYGKMGVPLTFMLHYPNPMWEIVGFEYDVGAAMATGRRANSFYINDKKVFARIVIRRVK